MLQHTPNVAYLGQADVKTITLVGKQWPIPLLAPRQNRHVVPAVLRLGPAMVSWMQFAEAQKQGAAFELPVMTEADHDALTTAVYWGLKRAHPTITLDEFLDAPISTSDLMMAYPVIAEATGMMQKVGEADPLAVSPAAEESLTGTE